MSLSLTNFPGVDALCICLWQIKVFLVGSVCFQGKKRGWKVKMIESFLESGLPSFGSMSEWKECMVFVGPTARKLSAHLCKESTTCAEMPKAPMLWVL